MCTLVILWRPGQTWPLLLAGNRDEMRHRPAAPPARHWPDQPGVVAGLDRLAGGSWMGGNDQGLVAVVMNRIGTLGPESGKRSRGELVLEALQHDSVAGAVRALAAKDPDSYRPFNLVIGNREDCCWLKNDGGQHIELIRIPPGLHMLSSGELNDLGQPRLRVFLPRFRAAPTPEPPEDWRAWQQLLADRDYLPEDGPHAAINLDRPDGFGTCSSSCIALPAEAERPPLWLFADGPPDLVPFRRLDF